MVKDFKNISDNIKREPSNSVSEPSEDSASSETLEAVQNPKIVGKKRARKARNLTIKTTKAKISELVSKKHAKLTLKNEDKVVK